MSCHDGNDGMSLEELQPSVKSQVDKMTAVGHDGTLLVTDSQEIGSQKTEELTVMETDTVLIICNLRQTGPSK